MADKKFSDYEKIFFEEIGNKTIKELIDGFRLSDRYFDWFDDRSFLMGLKELSDELEQEFFKFALKEKGFLDIPIIAAVYEEGDGYDIYSLMIEEVSRGYKAINFDPADGAYSYSLSMLSESDQTVDLEGCKTIGDFINKYSK